MVLIPIFNDNDGIGISGDNEGLQSSLQILWFKLKIISVKICGRCILIIVSNHDSGLFTTSDYLSGINLT